MAPANVVIALGLAPELVDRVRALDPRLKVALLSREQRHLYRAGRTIWHGYSETVEAETTADEEARRSLEAVLKDAEVLFTMPAVRPDILTLAPGLRWVQLASAGAERLLDSELVRRGVTLTTASGIHAVPMGEFVLGLMLSFAKGLHKALRAQLKGLWQTYLADELSGKTVGIVGLGAIGGQVARLAKAFGMRVIATRRSATRRQERAGEADELVPPGDLPYLLSESDYVVVAVPLTAETRHLIGEKELRAMKPSVVIINVSRGAVVDEAALVRGLQEGWIAGAALDVFAREPLPPDSPLWTMDNVIITPHVAGSMPGYMERAVELFCDNLRRYLAGEPLRNVVDVRRGY